MRLGRFAFSLSALLLACATSTTGAGGSGGGGGVGGGGGAGGGGGGSGGAAGGMGGAGGGTGGVGGLAFGGMGGAPPPPELYVHTNDTLYVGDPSDPALPLTAVGTFDCLGGAGQDASMTDVAVSASGELWGVSKNRAYRLELQGSSVHCAQIIDLQKPAGVVFYGLSFAPAGILHPTDEVLVAGNTAGELWAIAPDGTISQKGTLGVVPADDGHGHAYANAGKAWELSGDLVFLANEGSPVGFATVRDCPNPPSDVGCATLDTLVELDVAAMGSATTGSVLKSVRGAIVERAGCATPGPGQFQKVYGVAAFGDRVLGFARAATNDGSHAIEISNADGGACLLQDFPMVFWAGAGITTLAPIIPPA